MKERYFVVVCPKCGWVRGVSSSQKTAKCPRCGRVFAIHRLRVFAVVENREDLPMAIGEVRKKLAGTDDGVVLVPVDVSPPRPPSTARGRGRKKTALDIARLLCEKNGSFSEEEFLRMCEEEGIQDGEEKLAKLLGGGLVFEVRPGVFSCVK